uniref:Uncharacterized protein n=1 Tax=Timema shepardi TaxID=629360 RepID=A0A7R9G703_TIMSH|nr:unnamed protein product [Timema shepardi]
MAAELAFLSFVLADVGLSEKLRQPQAASRNPTSIGPAPWLSGDPPLPEEHGVSYRSNGCVRDRSGLQDGPALSKLRRDGSSGSHQGLPGRTVR